MANNNSDLLNLLLEGRPLAEAPPLPEGAAVELAALPAEGAALALEVGGLLLEPYLRPGDPAWRWRWVAPLAAGSYPLCLRAAWPDGRADELRGALTVAPRKLDQERYAQLLDDLQRLGRALVFALSGGATPAALPPEVDLSAPTPAEELAGLFGSELERLAGAVERIARRPPDRLRSRNDEVPLGRLRDAARVVDVRPERDAAELAASAPSYDSYEARLLRRLLDLLWRRLARLLEGPPLPPALASRAAAARERLRALRALPFLAAVPPLTAYSGPTPRIQRDADYRVVYGVWRQLRRRPLVSWDPATLAIPVADLPRLYERWCAAAAALALLGLPGLTLGAQALLADGDEPLLALPEAEPLVTLGGPGDVTLRLRYQARYTPRGAPLRSLDRHTRVPDLALEVEAPGVPPRVILLDAKYRLDASGGVPEDALADAYSYLGSIGGVGGGRAALAVALLYPGRGRAEIYPSGVAALPLLPGDDGALRAWLGELIAGLAA
jgi:large subunit ribosomal protein MRP49